MHLASKSGLFLWSGRMSSRWDFSLLMRSIWKVTHWLCCQYTQENMMSNMTAAHQAAKKTEDISLHNYFLNCLCFKSTKLGELKVCCFHFPLWLSRKALTHSCTAWSIQLPSHAVWHAVRHHNSLPAERIENLVHFLRYVSHVSIYACN